MPELPDLTVYVDALQSRTVGHVPERVRLACPFLLRTVEPSLSAANGRRVDRVFRQGKRIVFALGPSTTTTTTTTTTSTTTTTTSPDELYLAIHLMIAGRFKWLPRTKGAAP